MPPELSVVVDASPLRDARRTAGVGRYVEQLLRHLEAIDDLRITPSMPTRGPGRESLETRFLGAQPALLGAALRARPALVHATGGDPAIIWPLRRQVVTIHDLAAWTAAGKRPPVLRRLYLHVQRRRLRSCGALIAVSQAVKQEAVRVLGVSPDRIHVVPEGVAECFNDVAVPEDRHLRAAAGVAANGYLLWIGSLRAHDPRKGLDVLLSAAQTLQRSGPAHLVLAGATGAESARLARAAASAGVHLELTGYVPDQTLAALYRGAGAVVIPSLDEGFGLPMLEAMACGAPVVATRTGNLPDLAGDAALLVQPGDSEGLAAAIREVLPDSGLRQRLVSAGHRRAADFSWVRTAQATAQVYRAAAGRL